MALNQPAGETQLPFIFAFRPKTDRYAPKQPVAVQRQINEADGPRSLDKHRCRFNTESTGTSHFLGDKNSPRPFDRLN